MASTREPASRETPIRRASARTTSIPRSARSESTESLTRETARQSVPGSLGDLTHPINRERLIFRGMGKRLWFRAAAAVILIAIVGALFVIPVKSYVRQQDAIAVKKAELAALEQVNAELADEVTRLQTPDGIAEAAREEIGYVREGEIRLTVLSAPSAPLTMPAGWPYDAVAGVLTVRKVAALAAVDATSTTTPP